MSKIKYSSQWQVEKLEHEYFKEMKEDYQQQLALSQENQFNDYQYDYYSAKDENYYDKLKEIQRKIAKINHDNYKEFDNFFKSEDIFLEYWENIKKNYRIIYEIEKELIKMEEEIHLSLYMPAIIDDNKGEFQKFIDNLKKEIDEILKKYNNKEVIVITDIFGGSVNNLFMEEIPLNKNIHLITGLNLPLVLNLLEEQENYLIPEELIQNSIEISSDAVKYCNLELIKISKNEDEDF